MRRPMTVTGRRLDMEQVSGLQGLMRKRGLKCEEEAGSRGQVRWGDLRGHPGTPLCSIWRHIPLLHTENIYPFIPKTLIKCQLCARQELSRGDTTASIS